MDHFNGTGANLKHTTHRRPPVYRQLWAPCVSRIPYFSSENTAPYRGLNQHFREVKDNSSLALFPIRTMPMPRKMMDHVPMAERWLSGLMMRALPIMTMHGHDLQFTLKETGQMLEK
jgi:hypothetical protein